MQAYLFLLLSAIGIAVSLAAAAIAYQVSYSLSLKVPGDKKLVRRSALQTALYTYILAMVIALAATIYLSFSGILSKFL